MNPVKLSATSWPRKASEEAGRRPEAKNTEEAPLSRCSAAARTPARTALELNAPARPRSPATTSRPTVETCSCSWRIGRRGTSPAASAAWRVIRRMASAYGRNASMRCSARRRRAAATISIARVIFWMFLTDAMRLRTSRCEVAMGGGRPAG